MTEDLGGAIMTALELAALFDVVTEIHRSLRGVPLLEIGAGVGGTTRRISDALTASGNPAKLFTVDDCSMNPGRARQLSGGRTQREALLELVRERPNVVWVDDTSSDWFDDEGGPLEYSLVFIDGDHRYDAVVADLRFAKRVAVGGSLVLHDYGVNVHDYGPTRAFDEWWAQHSDSWNLSRTESLISLDRYA